MLFQGLEVGGQLSITTDVENYPGFAEVIQGPWLMEQMAAQATNCGAELVFDSIAEVDLGSRPFKARADGGELILAETLILATGAQARWLGLPSEKAFSGHGVSACATCDGFFFRGKAVAVVGGGNTAVEEALYLSQMASSVTLIHRRDQLRAEKVLQERLLRNPKITVHLAPRGRRDSRAGAAACGHRAAPARRPAAATLSELAVDGVFIAIGHDPATALVKGQLEMDADGYVITAADSTATRCRACSRPATCRTRSSARR